MSRGASAAAARSALRRYCQSASSHTNFPGSGARMRAAAQRAVAAHASATSKARRRRWRAVCWAMGFKVLGGWGSWLSAVDVCADVRWLTAFKACLARANTLGFLPTHDFLHCLVSSPFATARAAHIGTPTTTHARRSTDTHTHTRAWCAALAAGGDGPQAQPPGQTHVPTHLQKIVLIPCNLPVVPYTYLHPCGFGTDLPPPVFFSENTKTTL